MANSVDPDQTAPIGAVCSGSTLFVSILNSSVMLGNYLQQTTSADDIFRCIFFLGALMVKLQIQIGIVMKLQASDSNTKGPDQFVSTQLASHCISLSGSKINYTYYRQNCNNLASLCSLAGWIV